MPALELPNFRVVCQSDAIERWTAKKADLYPADDDAALIVDEVSGGPPAMHGIEWYTLAYIYGCV